jgi:hypothetical protein
MASDGAIQAIAGVAFLEGCNTMANITAKACSSPQTAEINADKRATTLMKWVNIGMAEGAALVIVAALISPEVGFAFVAGATLEAVVTYLEYRHAKNAGLASDLPGTES